MENTTTTAPSTAVTATPGRPPLRLHRSRSDRMISGVCGGLAETLGADATLIRLAAVVLTLLGGGIGIPLYVAAWIVLPEQS